MFLATTSLEEFWNKDEKMLFLGEWCKLYDKKKDIEKLDYETLDFIWSDLEKQKNAIIYCNDIYENILNELVVILNHCHSVNEDKKYWRILLSSWLLPFIQVVYDKYAHIQKALKKENQLFTYTLKKTDYITPLNYNNYMHLIVDSEEYNLQLYSQIFKFLSRNYKDLKYNNIHKNYETSLCQNHIKESILKIVSSLLNKVFRKKSLMIVAPYFKKDTIQSILKLLFKSKFVCMFDNMKYCIQVNNTVNIGMRQKIFKSNRNEFQNILYELFIDNFPKIYIEDYSDFNASIDKLRLTVPDAVFSSNALHGNDIFKFFVAKYKIRMLHKQHGGGYGLDFFSIPEKIERDSADIYYTQGWYDINQVIPLSSKSINIKYRKYTTINFIMTSMPRYIYRFNFTEDSSKMFSYIENSKEFLCNLKSINNVTIRMYMNDYKWEIKKRLLEINKNLKFDNKINYYKQIANARLNVFDHMHTGYLETLSMNIPTVIIIPKNIYYFRDSAKPYIQMLRDAKILFDYPIEASEFVDSIYDNIDKWWLSKKVQKIREEFCHNYARTSENWVDEWVEEFNKVLEER